MEADEAWISTRGLTIWAVHASLCLVSHKNKNTYNLLKRGDSELISDPTNACPCGGAILEQSEDGLTSRRYPYGALKAIKANRAVSQVA
jgi:hypothetical protein